ncbi:MAG: hypothetical protein ACM3SM_11190 [Bacteroidota bacterium]
MTSGICSSLIPLYLGVLCIAFFTGCSSSINLSALNTVDRQPVKNSIIYLIHGDGSYLYYDTNNRAVTADERILKQAQSVAEYLYSSEVFIFHIKIQRRFLGLIQRNDRDFYYYRHGKLIKQISYRAGSSDSIFQTETAVYGRLSAASAPNDTAKLLFFFYGHHIPEQTISNYYSSHTGISFGIEIFRQALTGFLPHGRSEFDLIVLSTCSNGTPGTISALSELSRYIIASPENLHLSYIDSSFLTVLEESEPTDIKRFAENFTASAFDILKRNTNTAITLSLYDTEATASFLRRSAGSYSRVVSSANENLMRADYSDCNYSSRMDMDSSGTGVTVYFRPSLFGKTKNRTSHSGWGCPVMEYQIVK